MLARSAHHPGLLMRVLASGQRQGNPDGGSHADHCFVRPAGSPATACNGIRRSGGRRALEEDQVAGAHSPITSILPDEGWAPLLEIIVREASARSIIEVNTVGMQALAARLLQEVGRQDVTVVLKPPRGRAPAQTVGPADRPLERP